MKYILTSLLLTLAAGAYAQSTEDYAVELTATVQSAPASITLHWKPLADTTTYQVFRKAKTSFNWGAAIATLATTDSSYTDNSIVADSAYEYQVVGNHINIAAPWVAKGYIYAGIRCPAIHNRGALVLMVDSTFSDSCSAALHTLMTDISGDGWEVIRHDVGRSMPDSVVKALIKADYAANPRVRSVYLLGHVAVPYSGDQNPDGHPDHLGAWPADAYYAYLSAPWTDADVNDATAGYAANWNIPGDGKWDQVGWSIRSELEVSRVDFYNMPAFAATEVQLMNNYLQRAHQYKMDGLNIRHRGLISDNFGPMDGEAFATSGWRNFAPLLGRDSFGVAPFIASLNSGSYQWAYGCGPGGFSSAGGIGSTADFATNNVNGIFTMLFGSYFGDWNVQNNFLRAPLCAATPALTCCWAGRPNWYFHHMALGDHIGYSAWHSLNNDGNLYGPANIYGIHQWVHIALMGDLTLRTDYIKPPTFVHVAPVALHGANITWGASPDPAVIGYYVYRADSAFGYYKRVSNMLTGTAYSDTTGNDGLKYYMVRPVKLQATPSGNYYNLGVGVTDTGTVTFSHLAVAGVEAHFSWSLLPNPATDVLNIELNNMDADADIAIVGLDGSIVYKQHIARQGTGANTHIDIKQLPVGTYLLQLATGGKTDVKKWTKL